MTSLEALALAFGFVARAMRLNGRRAERERREATTRVLEYGTGQSRKTRRNNLRIARAS